MMSKENMLQNDTYKVMRIVKNMQNAEFSH